MMNNTTLIYLCIALSSHFPRVTTGKEFHGFVSKDGDMNCDLNASTPCKSLHSLFAAFLKQNVDPSDRIYVKTDTNLIIDEHTQKYYDRILQARLVISTSPSANLDEVDVIIKNINLDTANWKLINARVEVKNCTFISPNLAPVESTLTFSGCDFVRISELSIFGNNLTSPALFTFQATRASLEGTKLDDFVIDNDESRFIRVSGSSILNLKEAVIKNTQGPDGIISVEDNSTLVVEDSEFVSNHVLGSGGCFVITNQSQLFVSNSTFANNSAGLHGGVVYSKFDAKSEIVNSTFTDNQAKTGFGGVIAGFDDVQIIVRDSSFERNYAGTGGGAISTERFSDVFIESSHFESNVAFESSGAIQCFDDCHLQVVNSTFKSNTAIDGGVISSRTRSTLEIRNSIFQNNTSTVSDTGVIVVAVNCTLSIFDSSFLYNSAARSAGVMLAFDACSIDIKRCKFIRNVASYNGGCMYGEKNILVHMEDSYFEQNEASRSGGAIHGDDSMNVTLTGCSFSNNTAITRYGGAISYCGTVNVSASSFVQNTAGFRGGAISFMRHLTVQNSMIIENYAFQDGGAIYCTSCTVTSIGSYYSLNEAKSDGGALYVILFSSLIVDGDTYEGNLAEYGDGGAINIEEYSVAMVNGTTFLKNKAVNAGGGIKVSNSRNFSISNSVFLDNYSEYMAGALMIFSDVLFVAVNCNFTNNYAKAYGGAIKCHTENACYERCTFTANTAEQQAGALYSKMGNLKLSESSFENNVAREGESIYIFSSNSDSLPQLATYDSSFLCNGCETSLLTNSTNFTSLAVMDNIIISEPVTDIDFVETPFASVVSVSCGEGCRCHYDSERMVNVYNCSFTGLKSLPKQVEEGTDCVNFGYNNISSISCYPGYFNKMLFVDLSFSGIKSIDESFFKKLASGSILRKLNLASNQLKSLPSSISKLTLDALSIGNNPYHCDCSIMWMRDWLLHTSTQNTTDYRNVICKSGSMIDTPIYLLDTSQMGCDHYDIWLTALVVGGTLLAIIIVVAVLFKNSGAIAFFLFLKFDILIGSDSVLEDLDDMEFDAFVTYSHKDLAWVKQNVLEVLEESGRYALCLHERDFEPGAAIISNITTAINHSRRIIMVLSRNYVTSGWCMEEFKMAHALVKGGRKQLLIPVMLEDVSSSDLDPDLQLYIKTYTYIKITNDTNLFRKKLIYSLPRKSLKEHLKLKLENDSAVLDRRIHQKEYLGDRIRSRLRERDIKRRMEYYKSHSKTRERSNSSVV